LPGGTPIFLVSRQQFMKYPGWDIILRQPLNLPIKEKPSVL